MGRRRGPTWEPSKRDLEDVFLAQNPWLKTGKVPDVLARPIERPLAQILWQRLLHDEPRRFQVILGPRRAGKTTVMYQTVRRLLDAKVDPGRLCWYRMDHPLLMQKDLGALVKAAVTTAEAATETPLFLFLDELTYADKWDLWLKTFYDESWPVKIIGSSSSTAGLRRQRHESGVGRWEEQYLAPYLFKEFLELLDQSEDVPVQATLAETIDACIRSRVPRRSLSDLRRRFLLTGGFPELLIPFKEKQLDDASLLLQSQQILRNDAVERALYKDIPQAFGVENPKMLERVLYTLAGQIGGILSPSSICQNLGGLSQPTLDRYLNYLTQAYLVFTLENYSGSEIAKQKRGRKLYFVDGAVRNAALQRGTGPLQDPGEMGLLMENLLAGHMHALSQHAQVRLYYWRDKESEVDLIYDHPAKPLAFEIGSSSHSHKGLQALMMRFPRFRGCCFYVAPEVAPSRPHDNRDQIGALPLDLLLLAVGAQAEQELKGRLSTATRSTPNPARPVG